MDDALLDVVLARLDRVPLEPEATALYFRDFCA